MLLTLNQNRDGAIVSLIVYSLNSASGEDGARLAGPGAGRKSTRTKKPVAPQWAPPFKNTLRLPRSFYKSEMVVRLQRGNPPDRATSPAGVLSSPAVEGLGMSRARPERAGRLTK